MGPLPHRIKFGNYERRAKEKKGAGNAKPLVITSCVGGTLQAVPAFGLRRMQQAAGCSARVSTRAPGLRPNWFWRLPGKSDWASAALTFAVVFSYSLRQFASARPLLLAARVHSGG